MTLLGISQDSDEMESSNSSVRREVEFESDADHKEMTRSYACDDYLSRWLPDIKSRDDPPRSVVFQIFYHSIIVKHYNACIIYCSNLSNGIGYNKI